MPPTLDMDSLIIFNAPSAAREVQRLTKLFVYLHDDLESSVMVYVLPHSVPEILPLTYVFLEAFVNDGV